jgi:hypothetical protein
MAKITKDEKQQLVVMLCQYAQTKSVQEKVKLADEIEKKVGDMKPKAQAVA